MTPTVLSIAGLDPSGGAGIAADLKTATAMGAYGMAALATVTVQHPGAVERVVPLPGDLVAEQVGRLLETMPVGAIKIGLLGSTEIVEALIPLLAETEAPVVVDPVRMATSGARLGDVDVLTMIRLLKHVTLVTPNTDELHAIVGGTQPGRWAIEHNVAILHTGGHGDGDTLHDVLWLPDGNHRRWSHSRIDTPHTHGSGCTLSTAAAVGLAQGLTLCEAVGLAIRYTTRLIRRSADQCIVDANGPLLHFKSDE